MSARSKSPSAWSMVSTCALRMMNSLRLGKSALAAGRTATAAPITTAALIRSRRVTLIGKTTLLGCVLMVFLFLTLRVQILEQQPPDPSRFFSLLFANQATQQLRSPLFFAKCTTLSYGINQQINSRTGGMHAAACEAGGSSYWHQPPRFHDIGHRVTRYWRVGMP